MRRTVRTTSHRCGSACCARCRGYREPAPETRKSTISVTSSSTVDAVAAPPDEAPAHRRAAPAQSRRSLLVLLAIVTVISVPLLIALGVLHSPRWFPLLDLAQTELRVRDVMSRHMPLIGLPGRF